MATAINRAIMGFSRASLLGVPHSLGVFFGSSLGLCRATLTTFSQNVASLSSHPSSRAASRNRSIWGFSSGGGICGLAFKISRDNEGLAGWREEFDGSKEVIQAGFYGTRTLQIIHGKPRT
jgi:hypothetical protein